MLHRYTRVAQSADHKPHQSLGEPFFISGASVKQDLCPDNRSRFHVSINIPSVCPVINIIICLHQMNQQLSQMSVFVSLAIQ